MTTSSTDTDDALIERLRDGDQQALGLLYHRHAPAVIGLARSVLRDQARAEEVAQTVFLRLWERPDQFDPRRGKLRSYLLTMSHTRAIDQLRADRARARRELADHHRGEPLRAPDTGEWLLVLRTDVRDALHQLPEPERAAIVTAYFGGYTYQQVAELLGEPEGTVKSRIRTGLVRLREIVGTDDGGER